jgi:hypothetical protein
VAECAVSKGKQFCGDCENFPCKTLKRYSFDAEQGDNGARIENCSKIKPLSLPQPVKGSTRLRTVVSPAITVFWASGAAPAAPITTAARLQRSAKAEFARM